MRQHELGRLRDERNELERRLKAAYGRPEPNDFLVRHLRQCLRQVEDKIFSSQHGPIH